jgi:hypothetical protein
LCTRQPGQGSYRGNDKSRADLLKFQGHGVTSVEYVAKGLRA